MRIILVNLTRMPNKLTTKEFILKAEKVHGKKYEYQLSEYISSSSPINITCPIHGEFKQSINSHKNGNGCNKCYTNNRKTLDKFINEANTTHNKKYDYWLN